MASPTVAVEVKHRGRNEPGVARPSFSTLPATASRPLLDHGHAPARACLTARCPRPRWSGLLVGPGPGLRYGARTTLDSAGVAGGVGCRTRRSGADPGARAPGDDRRWEREATPDAPAAARRR